MTIPEMTDQLARYWRQPSDIRDAPMTDEVVRLRWLQFLCLSEYSASFPTGAYAGKCWRRHGDTIWWLCWYGIPFKNGAGEEVCAIEHRRVEIVTAAEQRKAA